MDHIFENLDTIGQAMSQHDRKMISLLNLAKTVFTEPWKYKVTGSHITLLSSDQVDVGQKRNSTRSSPVKARNQQKMLKNTALKPGAVISKNSRKRKAPSPEKLRLATKASRRKIAIVDNVSCCSTASDAESGTAIPPRTRSSDTSQEVSHVSHLEAKEQRAISQEPPDVYVDTPRRNYRTAPNSAIQETIVFESSSPSASSESVDCELNDSLEGNRMQNFAFRYRPHSSSFGFYGNLPNSCVAENPNSSSASDRMKPKDAKPKTAAILQRIPHPEDPASCSTRGNPGVVLESSKSNQEESLPSENVQLRHLPTQDDGSFASRNTDDPDQATESDTQLVAVSSASSGNNLAQETLVDSMSESSGMLMRTAPDYQTPMHPKRSVPEPKVHSSNPNASTNSSGNHQTEELTDDQGSMELTDDQSVQTYPEQSQQNSHSALELNCFETIANNSEKPPIAERMTFSATNFLQPSSSFVEDHPPINDLPINGAESRKSESEGNASVNLGNTSLPRSGGEVRPPLKTMPGPELNFFGKPEDDAENCLDKTPSARKPNLNQTYLVCGASRSHLPLEEHAVSSKTNSAQAPTSLLKPSRLCILTTGPNVSTHPKNKIERGKVMKNAMSRKIELKKKLEKLPIAEFRNPLNVTTVNPSGKVKIRPKQDGDYLELPKTVQSSTSSEKTVTDSKRQTPSRVLETSEQCANYSQSEPVQRRTELTPMLNSEEKSTLKHSGSKTNLIPDERRTACEQAKHCSTAHPSAKPKITSKLSSKLDTSLKADPLLGKQLGNIGLGKVQKNCSTSNAETLEAIARAFNRAKIVPEDRCIQQKTKKVENPRISLRVDTKSTQFQQNKEVIPLVKSHDLEKAVQALTAVVPLRRSGRLINKANTLPNSTRPPNTSQPRQKAETVPNPKKQKIPFQRAVSAEMESERAAIYRTAPSSAKENENPQTKLYNSPEHCGSGKSTMTPMVESVLRSDPKINKISPSLSNRPTPKRVSTHGQKSDAKREKNSARYHNQDLNYIFKSLNCQKVRGTKK